MIRVGRPVQRENLAETDRTPSITPIFNQYSLIAPRQKSTISLTVNKSDRIFVINLSWLRGI